MTTRPNAETVGKLWVLGNDGRVYRQTSFSDRPTATFSPLDPLPDEIDLTTVVTSELAMRFTLLVPEEDRP